MKTLETHQKLPGLLQAKAQELGRLVRGARIKRRWTQAELAERASISIVTLQRLEKGGVTISFAAALMVCWLLDLPWKIDLDEVYKNYLITLTEDRKRARLPMVDRLDDHF